MIEGGIKRWIFASAAILSLAVAPPATADWEALLRDAGIRPVSPRTAAPDFTLPAVDGGEVSLSNFHGSWVVLTFWATWCGPCRSELPTLESLHRSRARNGLVVLGVSLDGDRAPIGPFMADLGLTFPNLWDATSAVGSSYLAASIPVSYLIDPAGQIAGFSRGARDWEAVAPVLDALMAAEPPDTGAQTAYAAPGSRVKLSTVLDPPTAEVVVSQADLRAGDPFVVKVRVAWSGSFEEYLLHPPEVYLPEGVERKGVTASTSSSEGRSFVTYDVSLEAAAPGTYALDPVELRYTPLYESSPVASRLTGPTVEVKPRTVLGLAPRTLALVAGGLLVLGLTGFAILRRRGAADVAETVEPLPSRLRAEFEAARAARLSGNIRDFVLQLTDIERQLDPGRDPGEDSDDLLEGVRYGGRVPDVAELDRLERRVEKRLQAMSEDPAAAQRRALLLREEES